FRRVLFRSHNGSQSVRSLRGKQQTLHQIQPPALSPGLHPTSPCAPQMPLPEEKTLPSLKVATAPDAQPAPAPSQPHCADPAIHEDHVHGCGADVLRLMPGIDVALAANEARAARESPDWYQPICWPTGDAGKSPARALSTTPDW